MNTDTVSSECYHKMHSACDYEDCACSCHLRDSLEREDQWSDDHDYIALCGEYE